MAVLFGLAFKRRSDRMMTVGHFHPDRSRLGPRTFEGSKNPSGDWFINEPDPNDFMLSVDKSRHGQ